MERKIYPSLKKKFTSEWKLLVINKIAKKKKFGIWDNDDEMRIAFWKLAEQF